MRAARTAVSAITWQKLFRFLRGVRYFVENRPTTIRLQPRSNPTLTIDTPEILAEELAHR
jgi:hypothetical protein